MADSLNSGSKKPQEMSMELRLLLAFVLMGVVMYISQTYFAPPPPPKKAGAPTAQTAPAGQSGPQTGSAADAANTKPTPPAAKDASAEPAPNATVPVVEPALII